MIGSFMLLNWLAIVVAVIVYFAWGAVWFQLVVARAYVVALGVKQKPGVGALVVPLACMTVTTLTSAMLLRSLSVTSFTGAAIFGLIVGIGYLVPMTVNIAMNPLFPRPFFYSLINAPFFVVGSVLISLILTAMR